MKILLIGDKESKYIWDYFDHKRFEDVAFVISTGDLKPEYMSFIVTMLNVPLYYVPGNHDSIYDIRKPEGCINIDEKIIVHGGLRIMGLGGSMLYNGGKNQWTEFQMYKKYLKKKPSLKLKGIDIFVAHSPAFQLNDGKDLCHRGFKVYRKIIEKYKPKYFLHGHQHLNYASQKRHIVYENTNIINTYEYCIIDYDEPGKCF